jgi:D-tyrosyl-tRNA(Tyr) deacylase
VTEAKVEVEGKVIGQIGKGYLIFLGVAEGDTKELADKLLDKMKKLRIFPDENGKSNLSIKDVEGEVLVISQFTLYADCKKGNRPSFINAAKPDVANELYEYFLDLVKKEFGKVESGEFGADMKVSLLNDGPFTILLDSAEICH